MPGMLRINILLTYLVRLSRRENDGNKKTILDAPPSTATPPRRKPPHHRDANRSRESSLAVPPQRSTPRHRNAPLPDTATATPTATATATPRRYHSTPPNRPYQRCRRRNHDATSTLVSLFIAFFATAQRPLTDVPAPTIAIPRSVPSTFDSLDCIARALAQQSTVHGIIARALAPS